MATLDRLLADAVTPALEPEGFTRTRRVFTRENSDRDRAFVEFRAVQLGGNVDVHFTIDVALQPRVYAAWLESRGSVNPSTGMFLRRPRQPVVEGRPRGTWALDLDDKPAIMALVDAVVSNARTYAALLERPVLLEAVRAGKLPGGTDVGTTRESALALLLADDGPSTELDSIVSDIRRKSEEFADFLVSWSLRGRKADGRSSAEVPRP